MKKALVIGITLLMLMNGMLVVVTDSTGSENTVEPLSSPQSGINALVSHAPIRINNNSDLVSAASSGSGTQADPYIIENYEINATGYTYGIYIGNTTDSFAIQNCLIYNASYNSTPYSMGAGIELYNNIGSSLIFNTTLKGNYYGIYPVNSSSPQIEGDLLEGNRIGLFSSNYAGNISDSTFVSTQYEKWEYGIPIDQYDYTGGDYISYLANATYTKLFNITNEVYFDTHIWGSSDAPDLDLGIFLDGKDGSPEDGQAQKAEFIQYCADADADEEVMLNLPESGTYIIKVAGYDVTGNPGHFDMAITTRSGYTGISLKNSSLDIVNTTIQNLPYGIVSENSNVTGNHTEISGSVYGIYISNSTTANISFMIIRDGTYGIYVGNSKDLEIYRNVLIRNSDYGIYFDNRSNGSVIWRNELYMNKNTEHYFKDSYPTQAFDDGKNYWNYSGIGNFWLDWAENNNTNDKNNDGIVDWSYPVDGAFDYYPLKNATYDNAGPTFNVISPLPSSNVSDPLPLIQVKITDDLLGVDRNSILIWIDGVLWNDTLISPEGASTYSCLGDGNFILTTMPSEKMSIGDHIINISASDLGGNPSEFSWNFTVWDVQPPEIEHNGYEMNSIGNSTEISAKIEDDFSVKTATLWYKGVGDSAFSSVPMSLSDGHYIGTIPAQLSKGTVYYYIEASDGINNATTQTYSTEILSDKGMLIRHNPVKKAELNMVIPIKADVVGASQVTLWYKVGNSSYTSFSMDNGGTGETYYGYIPPCKGGQKIYYYIEAKNASGTLTSPLNSSLPYQINITGTGNLRVAMQDDIKTLNPLSAGDVWTWKVIGRVFDGLTRQNASNNDHIEPWATEWFHHGPNSTWDTSVGYPDKDNNTDYRNWTVKLKDGLKWHDWETQIGADRYVRAHDVIFSLRLVADVPRYAGSVDPLVARNPDGSIMYGRDIDANTTNGVYDGVNISFEKDYPNLPVVLVTADSDDLTLHYNLTYRYADFTSDTLNSFIFPERIWKNHIADKLTWSDPKALISFGPFKFEYWNSTEHISEISTFWDYFQKTPEISGIKFTVMAGEDKSSAGTMSITRNKTDYLAWDIGISQAEYSYNFSNVGIEKNGDLGFFYLAFNMRDPDFGYADYNETDIPAPGQEPTYNHGNYTDIGKPFRLAIAHLINKTYVVEKLLKGYGNVEDSVVTDANIFWHDPNVTAYDYNLSKASEILNNSGYNDTDSNGIRELPNRGEAPIYILTPPRYYDPVRAKIGELIQENATKVGLNVKAVPTDFGTIVNKIDNHDFDMYILGWNIPSPISSATAPCDFFGSKSDGGGQNYPGYHNQSFDQLCEQMNTEPDINERKQIDFQLQEAVGYDQPYVPMYSRTNLEAHTNNFIGWIGRYGTIYNYESIGNITSPNTIRISSVPHSAGSGVNINISAMVTSHVALSGVWLNYTDVDGYNHNVSMLNTGQNLYNCTMPSQPHSGVVRYHIYAINSYNYTLKTENITLNVLSRKNITVHQGWNLITIRWSGEPVDINTAIDGNWTRAMVYIDGQWYTYNKNREAKYNLGFPKLNNTIGLWIYSPSADTIISYYLNTPTNTTIHLHKGWNLVGYPSGNDSKVSDALYGIPWIHLQTADADGNIYSLSSDDYLIVNRAYWIYVTSDCTWTVDW